MNKINLFCFPYAGGSVSVFNRWRLYLPPSIELKPVELAGRGRRMREPLLKNDFQLVDAEMRASGISPLDGTITVLLGKEDDLTADQCDGWKRHTKELCTMYHFEGGHLFLHDEAERIVKIISNTLINTYREAV